MHRSADDTRAPELPSKVVQQLQFGGASTENTRGHRIVGEDGVVTYYPSYFPASGNTHLFEQLVAELPWEQENAKFFGRTVPLPRLTSWHGNFSYSYSGVRHPPCAFTPLLTELQLRLPPTVEGMNCVLANYYRTGHDAMSWHADDEALWGRLPTICSVSFGATRRFVLKHRASGQRVTLALADGDVLVMAGRTQDFWLHAVPRTTRSVGGRINLTFRQLAS